MTRSTRLPLVARVSVLLAVALGIAGCVPMDEKLGGPPEYVPRTSISTALRDLPPPPRPVPISVYRFGDQTGQHKPNDDFAEYSRAVTQGALAMLVKAMKETGGGSWFMVIERDGIDNLLQERQLIRTVRSEYRRSDGKPLPDVLQPLLYPGVLVMGGVTAYESSTITGGVGARYLGIGGNVDYNYDNVTVDMRLVSVRSGEVFSAVTATKGIYSVLTQGGVFRIVGTDNLLEAEAGFSRNEPSQLAVRQAVEKALYGMIMEGALGGVWSFADRTAGPQLLASFLQERDGRVDERLLASIEPPPPPPAPTLTPEALDEEQQLLRELTPRPPGQNGGGTQLPPLPSGRGENARQQLAPRLN